VLDHRDDIVEELMNADKEVKAFLKENFNKLLKNKSFEEVLLAMPSRMNRFKEKIGLLVF
jgi:hypothetical protein